MVLELEVIKERVFVCLWKPIMFNIIKQLTTRLVFLSQEATILSLDARCKQSSIDRTLTLLAHNFAHHHLVEL